MNQSSNSGRFEHDTNHWRPTFPSSTFTFSMYNALAYSLPKAKHFFFPERNIYKDHVCRKPLKIIWRLQKLCISWIRMSRQVYTDADYHRYGHIWTQFSTQWFKIGNYFLSFCVYFFSLLLPVDANIFSIDIFCGFSLDKVRCATRRQCLPPGFLLELHTRGRAVSLCTSYMTLLNCVTSSWI